MHLRNQGWNHHVCWYFAGESYHRVSEWSQWISSIHSRERTKLGEREDTSMIETFEEMGEVWGRAFVEGFSLAFGSRSREQNPKMLFVLIVGGVLPTSKHTHTHTHGKTIEEFIEKRNTWNF